VEIWQELRGESVYPVTSQEKSVYASISKMKTFAPPTSDREYLFAHLLRNLESACIKARRYGLAPRKIVSLLRTQQFRNVGSEATLIRPSALPMELSGLLRELFDALYRPNELYRSTGVILLELAHDVNIQYSLFESPMKAEKIRELYEAMDSLSGKYGKHTLHLGASHPLEQLGKGKRGTPTVREETKFFGETRRRHLGLPIIHVK